MSKPRKDSTVPSSVGAEPLPMQSSWQAFSAMIEQVEPISRSVTCAHAATTSLVGKRVRAHLDHAGKIAACRSPQDVVRASTEFWQEATRAYAGYTTEIMSVWQKSFGVTSDNIAVVAKPMRDLLTVPDNAPRSDEAKPTSKHNGERHAA